MTTRPPFIELALRQPRVEGDVAKWLQEVINRSPHVFPKLTEDGVFGPHTAQETEELLYRLGHPNPRPAIGPGDLRTLWQWTITGELPADWVGRRRSRMASGFIKGWGVTARSWLGLHPPPPPADELTVYTRDDAGLRPPRHTQTVPYTTDIGAVLHWQGPGRAALGLDASFAQLRAWQAYHMDGKGWSDIAYNVAVPRGCPVGTVVFLRGFGVRGAHSGHNVANTLPGVIVMHGQTDNGPTDDQLATLRLLLDEHASGRPTGHNEWSSTACPGPALKAWIRANR